MGTYRPAFIGRSFFFLLFGAFGVATVVLLVLMLTGDESPTDPFVLFWLFALGWNAYWWLFRVVYSLTLRNGALEWEAPLRRGRIATTDLTAFRPMRLLPNVVVVKHTGGRPLLVLAGKGMADLAAELRRSRPDLEVRIGAVGRIQQRMPGRSAWYRDD
jgi:hypothetical protein